MDVPLPWSEGAQSVMMAIRVHAERANGLPAPVLLGVVRDTPPGVSAIARALRNERIWQNRNHVANFYAQGHGYHGGTGIEAIGTEAEAERIARAERAWEVGERHVLGAIPRSWFEDVGIQFDALAWAVHVAELGPATLGDVSGRWHGLVDSNIVLHFRDLNEIDWLTETHAPEVTLWLGVSLVNELEHLKYESGSRRARERAARFTKELGRQLDELLSPAGKQIRSGVQLRLWSAPGVGGMRDDDHLQTARTLRLRGIEIVVVTADVGVQARARLAGFDILEPSDQWQLGKELTPSEREIQTRLASAGIRLPPVVRMAFQPSGQGGTPYPTWGTLVVRVDELGGEALEIQCEWAHEGGTRVDYTEMTIGKTIQRYQDLKYHAAVPGSIAPGRSQPVALMHFEQPPNRLTYQVRAASSTYDGVLELKDGQFVEIAEQ